MNHKKLNDVIFGYKYFTSEFSSSGCWIQLDQTVRTMAQIRNRLVNCIKITNEKSYKKTIKNPA